MVQIEISQIMQEKEVSEKLDKRQTEQDSSMEDRLRKEDKEDKDKEDN